MTSINSPLISVVMITYNHENFIHQAIEGVLMQEFSGEIELIISNDCSPDDTDMVVRTIIENHPCSSLIKYTNHSINMGMMNNFQWALKQVKGKYIALCEGDDYWTDPNKLQKQYDLLERNPDYLLCAHRVIEQKRDKLYSIINNKTEYTFTDFSVSGSCNGVYTCSMIFRNSPLIFEEFLVDWILNLDGGDHLILLLSTINGQKIKLLNDVMGVYRIHDGGVWSSSSTEKKVKDAITTNSLYVHNLNLTKNQENQIIYGLTPRIRQYYSVKLQNKYFRKVFSILLRLAFISGPGRISNSLVIFFSNRILSKS